MDNFDDLFNEEQNKQEPPKKENSIRKNSIIIFVIWLSVYVFIIIPFLNNYFIENPQYLLYGFPMSLLFVYGSLFLIAFMVTHQIKLCGELSLWLTLGYFGMNLLFGSYCISPLSGELLQSETNYTCYFAADTFVAALLNQLGILFSPIMYLLVYFAVPAIFVSLSIYKTGDVWALLKTNSMDRDNNE
jgi:hypothetical protein